MLNTQLRGLLRVATHMKKYDSEMTMSRVQVLLLIAGANEDGALVRDLTKRTGLNQSTVARILSHLGEKPLRGHKEALNWITTTPDHEDPRRVRCVLTPRGQTVVAEIETLLK